VGTVGYGSYSYGSKNSKNSAKTQSNAVTNDNSKQTADTATTSFHTVVFGSLDRDPKISIKLAFP
jgi:hypothetical protein